MIHGRRDVGFIEDESYGDVILCLGLIQQLGQVGSCSFRNGRHDSSFLPCVSWLVNMGREAASSAIKCCNSVKVQKVFHASKKARLMDLVGRGFESAGGRAQETSSGGTWPPPDRRRNAGRQRTARWR